MSILVYRIEILINRLPALPLDTRPAFGMRLEFVEMGRRRRWSDAEKLRLVEASMAGRRMVSATARQHGISRSLLTTWRKLHREGRLCADAAPSFVPLIVAPGPAPAR